MLYLTFSHGGGSCGSASMFATGSGSGSGMVLPLVVREENWAMESAQVALAGSAGSPLMAPPSAEGSPPFSSFPAIGPFCELPAPAPDAALPAPPEDDDEEDADEDADDEDDDAPPSPLPS